MSLNAIAETAANTTPLESHIKIIIGSNRIDINVFIFQDFVGNSAKLERGILPG